MKILFDIESNGFLEDATKIHCLSYIVLDDGDDNDERYPVDREVYTVQHTDDMVHLLTSADCLVGHNIVGFDLPLISKLLGLSFSDHEIIDTLPLSWYLKPNRNKSYGLAAFGEDYGVPKPEVEDWEGLTYEQYRHRCEEDVKINLRLYEDLMDTMSTLYWGEESSEKKLYEYLAFKMQLTHMQEQQGWNLDVDKAKDLQMELSNLKSAVLIKLSHAMPEKILYGEKKLPAKMWKDDGSISKAGEGWLEFLTKQGLPDDTEGPVKYVIGKQTANPNSSVQVKDWLYSLGWEPKTFDYKRKDDGSENIIPQVRTKDKELCPSVLELIERDPAVKLLDGYTVTCHRLAIVEGFLKHQKDGVLKARVHGLTNTFRFKHVAPLVNLPGVDKPWGAEIRGLLVAPEGHVLCGADMVSLEDTTKRHYMYPFDPDYCKLMEAEDWDPHLDLAKFAGAVTQEKIDAGKAGAIRKQYKAANYACVYGVQKKTLARATGLSEGAAQSLIDAYWERNWAVEAAVEEIRVRKTGGGSNQLMWVKNPVSGFWMNLRHEKDKWSTINQSTGVYCFDRWHFHLTKKGVYAIAQFHDEIIAVADQDGIPEFKDDLVGAITETNNELNLNVTLGIDVQFGNNYAEIH